jgi:hypothetical protein
MTAAFIVFTATSAVLWLTIVGYPLALAWRSRAWRRRARTASPVPVPPVAVVVPTLNEAALIGAKLADLARTDYPRERLRVVVVDGGSHDGTPDAVRDAVAAGAAVELLEFPQAEGKADQLNLAFARLEEEMVVVTDADALLEPGCVREIVATLAGDQSTAVVGATVVPASPLLEERLHWWLVNTLWWLEGEVLSSGVVGGPCYGLKRSLVRPLATPCVADDVHVALAAGARGLRVRSCRTALATEVRVPRTLRECLRYRRRRAVWYAAELDRAPAAAGRGGYRLARGLRRWHLRVTPSLAALTVLAAAVLVVGGQWAAPAVAAASFGLPAFAAALVAPARESHGWLRFTLATARLAGILWLALLITPRREGAAVVSGGNG